MITTKLKCSKINKYSMITSYNIKPIVNVTTLAQQNLCYAYKHIGLYIYKKIYCSFRAPDLSA